MGSLITWFYLISVYPIIFHSLLYCDPCSLRIPRLFMTFHSYCNDPHNCAHSVNSFRDRSTFITLSIDSILIRGLSLLDLTATAKYIYVWRHSVPLRVANDIVWLSNHLQPAFILGVEFLYYGIIISRYSVAFVSFQAFFVIILVTPPFTRTSEHKNIPKFISSFVCVILLRSGLRVFRYNSTLFID